ncbi:MAG: ATP-grasp domain-containing protein [Paracoccaceae bacterium]|nr:ATP-grasp domain-containing protein [Paracoccaceae bacterium]
MAIFLAPGLAGIWSVWNRLTKKGGPVLVLYGRSYGRELLRRLREMNHYVILVEQDAKRLNWRFAHETFFLDVFDLSNTQRIADLARRKRATVALSQSDDKLLPQMAAVNEMLGAGVQFSATAIGASMSKAAMHAALDQAGVRSTPNAILPPGFDLETQPVAYPLIVKADMGQGAHGYRICETPEELRSGIASVGQSFPESDVIVEQYISGRQFDVEGIIHRGEVRIYIVIEENFFRYPPRFMRCWYLFNPGLDDETEMTLRKAAVEALNACEFRSGAFHVEVRLDADGQAYAIDISNRMGADFPGSVPGTTGRDMIGDYVNSMLGREVAPPPPAGRRLELRYYTHAFEPGAQNVRREVSDNPLLIRADRGPDGTEMFVFSSESEADLRALIGKLDEFLGNA